MCFEYNNKAQRYGNVQNLQLWIHIGHFCESSGYLTRFIRQLSVRDNLKKSLVQIFFVYQTGIIFVTQDIHKLTMKIYEVGTVDVVVSSTHQSPK